MKRERRPNTCTERATQCQCLSTAPTAPTPRKLRAFLDHLETNGDQRASDDVELSWGEIQWALDHNFVIRKQCGVLMTTGKCVPLDEVAT